MPFKRVKEWMDQSWLFKKPSMDEQCEQSFVFLRVCLFFQSFMIVMLLDDIVFGVWWFEKIIFIVGILFFALALKDTFRVINAKYDRGDKR